MSYQTIECEQIDDLMVLRHAREAKLNARTSQMYVEIMAVLKEASADDSVATLLLTGKGRFFSAGMDFNNEPRLAYEVLPTDSHTVREIKSGFPKRNPVDVRTWPAVKFIESFIHFNKPLIGAVNGPAIGEGFSSLLHCDVIYASDSAYFWAPFARAGVAPEFCSTYLMPKRLGATMAHAAMYLGKQITAEQARAVGFVLDIFPTGDKFETQVLEAVQQGLKLAGPPELRAKSLQAFKRLIHNDEERRNLTEICHAEFDLVRDRAESGDTETVQNYYREVLPQT